MSILEQLYNGKIFPAESCVPNDKLLKSAVSDMKDAEKNLQDTMSEGQKQLLTDYKDAYDVILSIQLEEFFKYGFVLGIKLQQEVESVKL